MKNKTDKRSWGRLFLTVLAAAVLPFTVAVFGPFEIFVNNKAEFPFAVGDFMPFAILMAVLAGVIIGAVLAFLRGRAFRVGLAVVAWLAVMVFLQGSFLNFGMDSLMSDGLAEGPALWLSLVNLVIWLGVGAAVIFAALRVKDTQLFTSLAAIAIGTVMGVQLINMGVAGLTSALNGAGSGDTIPEGDGYKSVNAILTDEGMFEVGSEENVIVFVLDRFDVYYYQQLVKADPRFFAPLDGFTYYDNNISLYSRTYPSITYMLTGTEQNFSDGAAEYFDKAYRSSQFFADLKANGYGINLYTEGYYAYRDANVLYGIADNVMTYNDYEVVNRAGLFGRMLALSAYRYAPTALKSCIKVSSGDFAKFIAYNGDLPRYVTDDAATYAKFREEGVTVSDSEDKRFTFIHLNGCHNPFTIDENGNRVEDGEAMPAIRGVFKMVFEYLDALRAAGLYEDATIIITGDHARAISDKRDVEASRVTALFVKEKGASKSALAYSSAPVSQANLRASIVKSAGIETDFDYGEAFSEVAEDADVVRKYCFEKTLEDGTHQIVEYAVRGDANDFNNWEIVDRRNIGKLYK